MTHLRKMMLEELQRLNYSAETIRSYIHGVEDFSQRFHCSPDRLGPRHIREYQAELFQKRKLSSGSVAVRLAALRFFYTKTLRRAWSVADTPYPKRNHRLSGVVRLLSAVITMSACAADIVPPSLITAVAIAIARSVRPPLGTAGLLRVSENFSPRAISM